MNRPFTARNALAWLLLVFASQPAYALLEWCDVSSTSLAFGNYDALNASPTDSSGTVTVKCSLTLAALLVNWEVRLDQGSFGSYATRQMGSGAHRLNYNIYRDAARTSIWGNGSGGTNVLSDGRLLTIGLNTFNYSMYGRIFAGQDRPAGAYSDTIMVTLLF